MINGVWRSLVARLVWDQKVQGSNPCTPTMKVMKKAKIYKPAKTAMQSGKRNSKQWLLEFDTLNLSVNPLMGWMSSKDTLSEIKLKFESKNEAQLDKVAKFLRLSLVSRSSRW